MLVFIKRSLLALCVLTLLIISYLLYRDHLVPYMTSSPSSSTSYDILPPFNFTLPSTPRGLPVEAFKVDPTGRNKLHLPNLTQFEWPPPPIALQTTGWPRHLLVDMVDRANENFDPILSRGQRQLLNSMLDRFSQLMDSNKLANKWYLCGGSLLGSFRHHDFVPWDDDIDICIDVAVRRRVQRLVDSSLWPDLMLTTLPDGDKLHTQPIDEDRESLDLVQSRDITNFTWPWPFLDLIYYKVDNTSLEEVFWPRIPLPIDRMQPFYYRPLGRAWYPTPRDIQFYLTALYRQLPNVECLNNFWSHAREKPLTESHRPVPCRSLANRYAFVWTNPIPSSSSPTDNNSMTFQVEHLVGPNSQLLHSIELPVPR